LLIVQVERELWFCFLDHLPQQSRFRGRQMQRITIHVDILGGAADVPFGPIGIKHRHQDQRAFRQNIAADLLVGMPLQQVDQV
jgi:hypothetical protein